MFFSSRLSWHLLLIHSRLDTCFHPSLSWHSFITCNFFLSFDTLHIILAVGSLFRGQIDSECCVILCAFTVRNRMTWFLDEGQCSVLSSNNVFYFTLLVTFFKSNVITLLITPNQSNILLYSLYYFRCFRRFEVVFLVVEKVLVPPGNNFTLHLCFYRLCSW